MSANDS